MSLSRQQLQGSLGRSPYERQSTPAGHCGTGLSLLVSVTMVGLVTILLVGITACGTTTATTQVPANWQTYHDQLGLYTLRFPPGWTAQGGVKSNGINIHSSSGSVTPIEEIFHFTDPAQGTGSAEVTIYTGPIKTTLDHQYWCQAYHAPNQQFTFHGITATHLGNSASWVFLTENAHFQFDVTIPGVEEPLSPTPQLIVTPLPATWVAIDKTDVDKILASYQPTDQKPLSC